MEKIKWSAFLFVIFLVVSLAFSAHAQQRYSKSDLNLNEITDRLYSVPDQGETTIELPNHMGNWREFVVRESNILDEGVRSRRTDYRTFTIVDQTNPMMKGRLSVSQYGIQAIILTPFGTIYIEPEGQLDSEYYYIYLNENPLAEKREAQALPSCAGAEKSPEYNEPVRRFTLRDNSILEFGDVTRTYTIAIVTTADFYLNNGSSVPMSETVIFNTMNSVQAIYGFDLKVEFNVLDPFVYTNPNTHPFTGENRPKEAADAVAMHFNTSSYDIGHVFHNQTNSDLEGSGGVAGLGVVCKNFPWQGGPGVAKGAGWSGAGSNISNGWIRLTAHEIGHMFDATHTFNGEGENCDDGAFSPTTNYEIGSGTTIMSYQGICSSDQNIPSSGTADNYFHANSLEQMVNYILNDGGCASTSSPENTPPSAIADPCGSSHVVPMSTPFYLVGEGEDLDGDVLTYTWEQFDNDGPMGPTWGKIGSSAASDPMAPIFRSYPPSTSPKRTIPSLQLLLDNNFSSSFEPLSTVERELTFRLTVRDQQGGIGMDEMTVNVENAGPFELSFPNGGANLSAGETTTVTWDVNGTDAFCDEVNLTLSIDGGLSFPISLAETIPNNGSASVLFPAGIPQSTQARLKVSCADNPCVVFFSISDGDFEIESDCEAVPSSICPLDLISGDAGDAAFDLDLEFFPGHYISSKVFSTSGGAPIYNITSEAAGGGCLDWGGTAAYDILEFSVTKSGNYSFSIQGFGGGVDFRLSNVFEGSFDPNNTCDTWIASNSFDAGGGSISGFGTYNVTLESCKTYFITLARFFGTDPFTTTINFSGPGDLIEVEALPGTNAYTYIAVNSNTQVVAAASSSADFTGLGGGEYCVWGVMYKNSGSIPPANLNPNDFVGQELGELLSQGNCMLTSYECKPLSIISSEVCDATFVYNGVSSLESAPFNSVQFCSTDSNPTPVISGNSGGTFTSDSGDIEINSTTGQINLENSIAGTYLITYQDDTEDGCEESIEVVIADGPTATAGDNGPLCEGEDLELTAEGGLTYSWSGPDGFTSDEQNPVIDEVSLAGEG
nr:hypothetical protein [Saprospiraceae bacterium]